MKIGDLVRCNEYVTLGIITKIADANPHTGNTEWVYHVLWTDPAPRGREPGDVYSWERLDNFTPIPDEECMA